MTRRTASRARLRPFRIEDAADVCRIYPMFFVDNAIDIKGGRLTVAEIGGEVVGFVLWSPALETAWFDPGVEHWAELCELRGNPTSATRRFSGDVPRDGGVQRPRPSGIRESGFPEARPSRPIQGESVIVNP